MAFAHNRSVEIYYETFGDASNPALLLINGLGSQCINFDVEFCEMFVERGFFVIRFDNRDVGLSTKFNLVLPDLFSVLEAVKDGLEPKVAYRLSDMADDAVAVLDDLGIDRAHVAGWSIGGMIAQQLAIDHPDRLLSMTSNMSTTGDPDVGQPSAEALDIILGPSDVDRDSIIRRRIDLERVIGSRTHFDPERVAKQTGDAYDRCFNLAGVARQLCAAAASGSRTSQLHDVTVATLVMHGDVDNLINISGGVRTAESIPGARLVILEGMGHDLSLFYWDQLVEEITSHAQRAAL
ncbi:MAG: alpha/beta hydrolase [Acidimicrobiales bacterium]